MVILKTGDKVTVKAGGDIINSPVTHGFTQEEYEKGLRERESEIRDSLQQLYECKRHQIRVSGVSTFP